MRKLILLAASCLVLAACQTTPPTTTTEAIPVDASADTIADQEYMEYLAPTKEFIDAEMGAVLGYAPERMYVSEVECPMLNWSADALLEAAQEVCPKHVDVALLNRGGTRCNWAAGDITRGHVFKMMSFDNKMVVLTLKGADIIELFEGLASGQAQGIAGMRVKFKDKKLAEISIGGKPVDPEATYRMATNSYLAKGKDGMIALTKNTEWWDSGLLIRDIYINAVRKQGTVCANLDGRMAIE